MRDDKSAGPLCRYGVGEQLRSLILSCRHQLYNKWRGYFHADKCNESSFLNSDVP